MDVLVPKLVWLEGRCYRFYDSDVWSAKDHESTPYVEESNPREFSDLNEETCPLDVDIVSTDDGKYKHSFYIPKVYFRYIVGLHGKLCKTLERETGTSIAIPNKKQKIERRDIVITSASRAAIISAKHRINLIVESSRKKVKPTHFVAIPMRDKNIASNFETFKNTVLNETGKDSRGVQEGIFQKPEKMHLTLGMLALVDEEEVKTAVEALEECCETILKPIIKRHGPIKIKVQGLEYFNDDPTEVRVLYGKVTSENNALQELAEKTVEYFEERGLMRKEHEKLNLHLTLMNASFMADKDKPSQSLEKFDVTNIMKVHKDYYFGEIMLEKIHLCYRGIKHEDKYYTITSEIRLDKQQPGVAAKSTN